VIYGPNIPLPVSLPQQAHHASHSKSHDAAEKSKALDTSSPGTDLDSAEWTNRAQNNLSSPLTDKRFPAALPPIADQVQAAEATQHVLALMRAQPLVALQTQANTSSQSVQRLLQ
jgi:hypothetical protein